MTTSQTNTFTVKHLDTQETFTRAPIFINPHLSPNPSASPTDPTITSFHYSLPSAHPTPLTPLPSLATALKISHLFIKNESLRFDLPSFKILGASWSIHRAICAHTSLPPTATLAQSSAAAQRAGLRLVTCSSGNWGRAVARMAAYLGIQALVLLPAYIPAATREKIRSEGASVEAVPGSYDGCVREAARRAEGPGMLLVLDTSWDGFEDVPKWVVEGYSTMLAETDAQVREACGRAPSYVICPVGVGSIAQAVTAHYNATSPDTKVVAVEAQVAPCLMESLICARDTAVEAGESIMPGMNCGTLSKLAWPVLRDGVFASVAVSDLESHECVQMLAAQGINAGPCGAATLAAAKTLQEAGVLDDPSAVVVLFCTEGQREYDVPQGQV